MALVLFEQETSKLSEYEMDELMPVMVKCLAQFENMFQGNAYRDNTISATDGNYKNYYMAGGQFKPVPQ